MLTVPNSAVRQQGGASTVVVYEPSGDQRTVTFEAGVVGRRPHRGGLGPERGRPRRRPEPPVNAPTRLHRTPILNNSERSTTGAPDGQDTHV